MLIFPWMLATSLTLSMYLLTAVDRSEVGIQWVLGSPQYVVPIWTRFNQLQIKTTSGRKFQKISKNKT